MRRPKRQFATIKASIYLPKLQCYCCKTVITIAMHAFEWTVENAYESLNIFYVQSSSTWVPMLF